MMAELHEIQAAMEQAADLLATRPAETWAGWVTYLLEALDDKTDADTFAAVLGDVQADIATRLEGGRW